MDQTTPELSMTVVDHAKQALEHHPVYAAITSPERLKIFMEHHVYSVWDFMSLIKYLHVRVPPTDVPWLPGGDAGVRRFVNELLMEEESDEAPSELGFAQDYVSHFELYSRAMEEVGASPARALAFLNLVRENGIQHALDHGDVPEPSRAFMRQTFAFIETGKPHVVAAALAFGREHVIPWMFRSILKDMEVGPDKAPVFDYYLKRHIHLDADHHGPLSLALVDLLCAGDPERIREAEDAARKAVDARIAFWHGVHEALA